MYRLLNAQGEPEHARLTVQAFLHGSRRLACDSGPTSGTVFFFTQNIGAVSVWAEIINTCTSIVVPISGGI